MAVNQRSLESLLDGNQPLTDRNNQKPKPKPNTRPSIFIILSAFIVGLFFGAIYGSQVCFPKKEASVVNAGVMDKTSSSLLFPATPSHLDVVKQKISGGKDTFGFEHSLNDVMTKNVETPPSSASPTALLPMTSKPTTEMPTNKTDNKLGLDEENSSFVWNSLPPKREGFGVLYCAYSKDTNTSLPKFFKEAATSAKQLKANNPTISTAIITNANQEDVPDVFDHIIKVKDSMLFSGESTRTDGIYRQWFSRIYYLAHSPFEVTWYVDSHAVFVTTELEQAFREFEKLSIDIAVASSNPKSTHVVCHNFALIYRWNNRVKKLFVDWILEQLNQGIATDDQGTLCRALKYGKNGYGIMYAPISPQWAFAWLSLRPQSPALWRHRTTRVLSGKAHICHSSEGNLCHVASNEVDARPRIYYHNHNIAGGVSMPVYNETHVNSLLPYSYPSYDWQVQADKCQGVVCI